MQQNFPRKNVEKFTIVRGYFKPFNLILKQYYICIKHYLSTTLIYLKTVVNIPQQNFEINLALHSILETNSVSSRLTCYLLQTDTKYFFFCMKSNHLGLQYRDLSSHAHHFVMRPCQCCDCS